VVALNVAVTYPVECTVKRARSPKTFFLTDTIPVEIACANSQDVVTAVKIARWESVRPLERVHCNGALYENHQVGSGVRLLEEKAADAVSAQKFFRSQRYHIKGRPPEQGAEVLPLNVETILKSGFDEMMEDVRINASKLLFIDGILYQKAQAPVFEVRHALRYSYHNPQQDKLDLVNQASGEGVIFAANRLDEARSFLRNYALLYDGKPPIIDQNDYHPFKIEVWDETLIGQLHEREIAAAASVHYVLQTIGQVLPLINPDAIEALGRLTKLRQAAIAGDISTPNVILGELDIIAAAQADLPIDKNPTYEEQVSAAMLRLALEIGRAAIALAPVSTVPDVDPEVGRKCAKIGSVVAHLDHPDALSSLRI